MSVFGPRDRLVAGACVALGVAERVGLVVLALQLTHEANRATAVAGAALALLFIARRALTGWAVRRARAALTRAVVRSMLDVELPLGSPLEEQDTLGTAFDGITVLSIAAGDQWPALAASALAVVGVTPFVLHRLPARVAFVGIASVLVASLVVVAMLAATRRWSAATQRAFATLYDDVATAVGGRLDIVASGGDLRFEQRVDAHVSVWLREALRGTLRMGLAGRAPAAAALLVGAVAVLVDGASRGELATAIVGDAVLLASVAPALAGVVQGAIEVFRVAGSTGPFLRLLTAPVSPSRATGSAAPPEAPAAVDWDRVSFAYPGAHGRPAVRDFSATWRPGTVLALSGPNGSGKSTLLRMALGIGRPTSGRVCVGGVDLTHLDVRAWRSAVAYLPQRPFLPERATAREAVRFIADDATDRAIRSALERVDLWSTLAARDAREPLGVRVGTLSAGQRQRLALARLLCQRAKVLILDEPDANIDSAGLTLVAGIVREAATEGMVLLAAHTPDILKLADEVLTLPGHRGD